MMYINLVSYVLNLAWFVAVGSLLVLRPAWDQMPNEEPQATALAMMDTAQSTLKRGHPLVADTALPPSPPEITRLLCDSPPRGVRPPMLPPPSFGPLAAMLGGLETKIGIRTDQLDLWCDFTDALLRVAASPSQAERAATAGSSAQQVCARAA